MNKREIGKIDKYKMLKGEITRMWSMKKVIVVPVVVGALGAISTGFEKYVAAIETEMKVEHAQKNSLIGNSKDFETGTWMLKKKKKTSIIIISIIVQDFTLTELAGATNNKHSKRIISEHNNKNSKSKSKDIKQVEVIQCKSTLNQRATPI